MDDQKSWVARVSIINQQSHNHQCFYWYGIIRFTLRRSPGLTSVPLPSLRLRFLSFEVRMWRRCECPRFTFPVAVFLKRFDAPLCVFNFGISPQNLLSAFGSQLSSLDIQTDL